MRTYPKGAFCFLLIAGCIYYVQGESRVKRGIPGVPITGDGNDFLGNVTIRQQQPNSSVYISCDVLNKIVVNSTYLTSVKVATVGTLAFVYSNGTVINEGCSQAEANGGYTFQMTKFAQCASSISTNGNELSVQYQLCVVPAAPTGGVVISRDTSTLFKFTCNYRREVVANMTHIRPIIGKVTGTPLSKNGAFSVVLGRYTDGQYTTVQTSPDILVPNRLFLKVKLDKSTSSSLIVQMLTCWATPSANSNDASKFYIIERGCPSFDPWDPMSNMVTQNYNSTCGKFSFLSFVWRLAAGAQQRIFVHCEIEVCENSKPNSQCTVKPNCTSGSNTGLNGRRRRSEGSESKHLVSAGPFHMKQKGCDKVALGCSHACAVNSLSKAICTCPVGWALTVDSKTCAETFAGEGNTMQEPRIIYVTEKRAQCIGMLILLLIASVTVIGLVSLKPKKLSISSENCVG
ncbi:ZP domain-containing protein-like [Ciona intestinalis]